MVMFKAVDCSFSSFFRSLRQIVSVLVFVGIATSSTLLSATPVLSKISCGRNAFSSAGSDPCSLYLASPASGRVHVTLSSNNPAVTVPSGVTVRPGASTTGFNAAVAAVTTNQTATITAQSGGATVSFVIALTAGSSPALALNASSLAFGNVSVGTAVSKSVTVTSTGTAALTISSASISGTGFTLSGGSFPVTLNPGQAMVLTVQFNPVSASTSNGQLTILSNAPAATVGLSGTGITVTPAVSALTCSSGSITGALADTCTVTLCGSAPSGGESVALTSSSSAVTLPAAVMVPATATSASFTANAAAVASAQTVTLTATAGGASTSASLQLNAANPLLSLNASSISFGAIVINNATTQTVSLTSAGTAPVTVSSIVVTGSGFSAVQTSLPVTLSPGQSLNVSVTFDPSVVGPATGKLTVTSNSSANATAIVALSGTGNPHQVYLSWAASSGPNPISGYNVYRAAGGSSSFAVVNPMNAQTDYTDASVQAGTSYSYYVTSVDSSGAESAPSNVTSVTVP